MDAHLQGHLLCTNFKDQSHLFYKEMPTDYAARKNLLFCLINSRVDVKQTVSPLVQDLSGISV